MQKLQNFEQPSMMLTKAVGPSARGAGRASNFSMAGKLMSTAGLFVARVCSSSAGRRCRVCGPKTMSTIGARRVMASPSWLATQPPTPISRAGLAAFQSFQRPSSEKTFSCAFSRTEQVLSSSRSASSGTWVRV